MHNHITSLLVGFNESGSDASDAEEQPRRPEAAAGEGRSSDRSRSSSPQAASSKVKTKVESSGSESDDDDEQSPAKRAEKAASSPKPDAGMDTSD